MSEEVKEAMCLQVRGVASLLGENEPERRKIFRVLGKVMSNAFNVMDSNYDEVIGLGIYSVPSLLNHSCDPNSAVVFEARTLFLRSIKPLMQGDQVSSWLHSKSYPL